MKKLKYFSRKSGWDQYWDLLEKSPKEDLYIKAMYHADSINVGKLSRLSIVRNFVFIWAFNRYMKENR